MSFTWVNGRQLGALQKGDLNVSYSYNSDGLRVSKTVNGVKTEYVWDGSSLIGQKTGNNVLVYLYAADGLAGFQYNGVNYYYLKNGQGDVVGILNSSGTLVAKYTYDAWGKLLSVTDAAGNDKSADASFIGNINPIRYRSYYYDTETGLYYLQSRYYDPEVGRFINADGLISTDRGLIGFNMFVYCGNNPVNRVDPTGENWFTDLVSDIVDSAVEFVGNFLDDYNTVDYETVPESNPPAIRPRGEVIIVKPEDQGNVILDQGDVLVIDKRDDTDNPNMQVVNSFSIIGETKMNFVIDAMLEYNLDNPSETPWIRSRESMLIEWRMHNFAYRLLFFDSNKRLRAASVDFDNNDEGTIFWDFLFR